MIKYIDKLSPRGKTIIVRTDLNSSIDPKTKKIKNSLRLKEYSKTVRELSNKGGKIVLLAHQGRRGDPDFTSLREHAKLFSRFVGKKVVFIDDIAGKKAKSAIMNMKNGDIILLDNVRFLSDETEEITANEHARSTIVKSLAPLADAFVNDAFSVSHRSHASVVGFAKVLPVYAGRIMQGEITAEHALLSTKKAVYLMGGAKCDDIFDILEHMFRTKPHSIEKVLTSGVTANVFLIARGIPLDKGSQDYIKNKGMSGLVKRAQELDKKFRNFILVPQDIAYESKGKRIECAPGDEKSQIEDIGTRTIAKYSSIISNADTIIFKGPCGVYENNLFTKGTRQILIAVSKSKAYTIVAGGDSTSALEALKIPAKKFSHVSLGGGAFITYISGKKMPGIEALDGK